MSEEAEGGRIDAALSIADQMLAPGATARLRERLNGATRGVSESVLSPITSVLDLVGVSALQPSDRAEIEYARAATLLVGAAKGEEDAPGLLGRAETALERARGAAPGDVCKSAVYNQGTLDLMAAEAVRATIPEIAGAGGAGPTSPPDPTKTEEDEDAPDPLDVARALYLQSRAHLVEYLTEDEGEDASANVELVIRRLRELDAIEKQREEQEQEESEEGEDGDKDKQEPSDEDQEKQDDQKSDEEPSEDEQESEEQGEDDPSEEDSEEDPEEESEGEPEEEPEEGEEEEPKEEPQPGEEKIEETTMTAEEFQRLLEQNKKHQERGEEIRRIRTIRGKIPAKKDW